MSNTEKIDVFGFVPIAIGMPNHVHLIWRTKELNGKETAQGSFLKYTAHEFRKMLYQEDRKKLLSCKIEADNKQHEFWQRDPLAILCWRKRPLVPAYKVVHLADEQKI